MPEGGGGVCKVPKIKQALSGPRLKPSTGKITKALLAPATGLKGPSAISLFPSGYGFVVLTAVGSVVLVMWKSSKVGIARDEYKISYPNMYSSENMAFNCVQRAHQNTLENYPQFLFTLLVGGLEMPYFCSIGGIIWIMGRICYANGYYTGDPRKRARGTFGTIGMVMCLAATLRFALKHLN